MNGTWLRSFVASIGHKSLERFVETGISPNQITCIGLALVLFNCAFYLFHKDMFFLGLGLALSYSVDALDGAVARRLGKSTKFGGYLDSVVDRYQEIASYLVLGVANSWWLPVFLLTTGSMMVSYNKAAAAIQIPINNKAWPDLMERARRAPMFVGALILDHLIYIPDALGGHLVLVALYYLAALTHFTALQRFLRARNMLVLHDTGRAHEPSTTP